MKKTIPLGETTAYVSQYDASVLYPIKRTDARGQLGLQGNLPFRGNDCWTAYEVSWLDQSGKPQVRLAEFWFEYDSPCIVESKSFKLYLNSFNQTAFASESDVINRMMDDLSTASGAVVTIQFYSLTDTQVLGIEALPGELLDNTDIPITHYHPYPQLLAIDPQKSVANNIHYSHLLKTNCPVTNQPDWATVFIEYSGDYIKPDSLLAYIISFREHQDFHENCVERLFCDIQQYCQPEFLSIYARYTRRGGLDINPFRTNYPELESQLHRLTLRTIRQ